MTKRLTVISTILICIGCNDSKTNLQTSYRQDRSVSDENGVPKRNTVLYFDPKSFRGTFPTSQLIINQAIEIEIDSGLLSSFSNELADNQELVLSNYYLGKDIYRLTWLRSFHQGVVIKIFRENDGYTIEKKWLKSDDKVQRVSRKRIAVVKVSELNTMLNKYNYFKTESFNWVAGLDGSEWILEVHLKDKYHFLNRWSPDYGKSNGLRELGEFMIRNSEAKDELIY